MKSLVYIKNYNPPEINKIEVLRYAGVNEENDELLALLDECIVDSKDSFSYKVCYGRFKIEVCADEIDLGFSKTHSHSLARCLNGCEEIFLICATVGHKMDRLISKYSVISPAKAVMLQALGSERVEALCDMLCDELAAEEGERGFVIRPRFSPGYGDLSLELQKDIFSCLDCSKNVGVSLNENLLMSPSKSVTAIIGIKKES